MAFYGTLTGANTYHSERGNADWTGSDQDKLAAMTRGSLSMDGTYRYRWPGVPVSGSQQELAWPRTGAVDNYGLLITDDYPLAVVNASYEYALAELRTPASTSPFTTPSQRKVLTEVKGIKWTVLEVPGGSGLSVDVPILYAAEYLLSGIVSKLSGPTPTAFVV
jgi:hypothetical protein